MNMRLRRRVPAPEPVLPGLNPACDSPEILYVLCEDKLSAQDDFLCLETWWRQQHPDGKASCRPFYPEAGSQVSSRTDFQTLALLLRSRQALNHPTLVREYLQLQIAHKAHECFGVLFLDSQHQLIEYEILFRGTLNQTSVYPREVALRALHHHAASVVLSHNHPSGHTQPSAADVQLTRQLMQALGLLDIRVLDHVIVTQGRSLSMAEEGLMPAV